MTKTNSPALDSAVRAVESMLSRYSNKQVFSAVIADPNPDEIAPGSDGTIWKPSTELRFVRTEQGRYVLQQRWQNCTTWAHEWRVVPTVEFSHE